MKGSQPVASTIVESLHREENLTAPFANVSGEYLYAIQNVPLHTSDCLTLSLPPSRFRTRIALRILLNSSPLNPFKFCPEIFQSLCPNIINQNESIFSRTPATTFSLRVIAYFKWLSHTNTWQHLSVFPHRPGSGCRCPARSS